MSHSVSFSQDIAKNWKNSKKEELTSFEVATPTKPIKVYNLYEPPDSYTQESFVIVKPSNIRASSPNRSHIVQKQKLNTSIDLKYDSYEDSRRQIRCCKSVTIHFLTYNFQFNSLKVFLVNFRNMTLMNLNAVIVQMENVVNLVHG